MATTITLDDLSSTAIEQAEEFLASFIEDEYPHMDTAKGRIFRQIVLRPAAIFHTYMQTQVDRLRDSWSLLAIEQDPTLADDDTVDKIASNYLVERVEGSKATGQVAIVLSTLKSTTIPSGSIFEANGRQFVTIQSYIGVTTASAVLTDTDRLITARSDGTYVFTVDVEATEEGAAGRLTRNTQLAMQNPPDNFVYAYAESDFTGGTSSETNEQLVQRIRLGMSYKALAGRNNIVALLQQLYPTIMDATVIGMGDPECIRDRHNIWSGSMGGKVDIYVKTQSQPDTIVLTKTATLIDPSTGTWQLSISRDDAPGFYRIEAIKLPSSTETFGGYEITSETRSIDLSDVSGAAYTPDIDSVTEGAYTRYQAAVVQFIDTDTDTSSMSVGAEQEYKVYVSRMPYIQELQDIVTDPEYHNPAADYLVRAPIPCFVSVTIKIKQRSGSDIDTESMKSAIAERVNQLSMEVESLPASIIIETCHEYLGPSDYLDLPIDMVGTLRKPNGDNIILRSGDTLDVPSGYEEETVSGRTTAFYLSADDIDVSVEQVE